LLNGGFERGPSPKTSLPTASTIETTEATTESTTTTTTTTTTTATTTSTTTTPETDSVPTYAWPPTQKLDVFSTTIRIRSTR